jgi:hypothetical protein
MPNRAEGLFLRSRIGVRRRRRGSSPAARSRKAICCPGADTRRFAVQEFVNLSDQRLSMTIVPLEAFALRLDLDPLSFEALGSGLGHVCAP